MLDGNRWWTDGMWYRVFLKVRFVEGEYWRGWCAGRINAKFPLVDAWTVNPGRGLFVSQISALDSRQNFHPVDRPRIRPALSAVFFLSLTTSINEDHVSLNPPLSSRCQVVLPASVESFNHFLGSMFARHLRDL